MSTWTHRIMRQSTDSESDRSADEYYCFSEVYLDDQGEIQGWSGPAKAIGKQPWEVVEEVFGMLQSARLGILVESQLPKPSSSWGEDPGLESEESDTPVPEEEVEEGPAATEGPFDMPEPRPEPVMFVVCPEPGGTFLGHEVCAGTPRSFEAPSMEAVGPMAKELVWAGLAGRARPEIKLVYAWGEAIIPE